MIEISHGQCTLTANDFHFADCLLIFDGIETILYESVRFPSHRASLSNCALADKAETGCVRQRTKHNDLVLIRIILRRNIE